MLQICTNIKKARDASGLSQQEMADRLNIKRSKYKNWEINTEPRLSEIKTIADILGVPPASLLSGVIEFGAEDIIVSNNIDKQQAIKEIHASLNKLTSAIGLLSGLSKEEISVYLPAYPSGKKGVFEQLREPQVGRKKRTGN